VASHSGGRNARVCSWSRRDSRSPGDARAYLKQQRGYGIGEALLFRKYPLRNADQDGMYAGPSWIGSLLGGARVYYGEFGRGLFQTVYSAGNSYAELPLTIQWIGLSLIFLILGIVSRLLGALGSVGIALSILVAAASAASAPLPYKYSGPIARTYLWIVNLLGPAVRSFRARARQMAIRTRRSERRFKNGPVELHGQIEFVRDRKRCKIDSAAILDAIRDALVHRGVAIAETDGFQSYDLEIVVPPMIRVPINALHTDAGLALLWRVRPAPRHALIAAAVTFMLLAAAFSFGAAIVGVAFAVLAVGVLAITRARRIPAIIKASATEVATSRGISIATRAEGETR